ncbi:hypothetical protein [Clostridium sp. KNHs216]|uniref:hypothetical protein n=1 Tax=Clostridium sp. KNHs216 TaxID=1550235 RepID=UPI00114F43F3|nr:hypothetical protein [Clostridium sp. KNHs216]TQI66261.1 hypothetical protein LY85_0922 [Clostridium sp. KNHs216]
MAKYRKRPVVIEAFKYNVPLYKPNVLNGAPDFIINGRQSGKLFYGEDGTLKIKTLEGIMTASTGDFIICGVNGELYPCKPDIFEKTYEPAE